MLFVVLAGGQVFLGQLWGALLVIAGALLAQLPLERLWARAGR